MPAAGGRLALTVLVSAVCGLTAGLLGQRLAARALPVRTEAAVAVLPAAATTGGAGESSPAGVLKGADQVLSRAFVMAARRVNPAVVNIDNLARRKAGGSNPFEDVVGPKTKGKDPVLRGAGSGFIFNAAKGLVLTNQHVVENAERIDVTLSDGRVLTAEVVGADKVSDIAVLRVAAEKLPEAPLALKAKLEQGEWVIAIGNPFRDFPHTVTVGVVSALNRNMQLPGRDYSNLIQTDAAINVGNSGGPLCNLRGEVIGINSAIFSPTQTNLGLGFAIAIDDALQIAGHLATHGGVPWLGIGMLTVDDAVAAKLKKPGLKGVLVDKVREGSPAAKAGLLEDDVVVQANGQRTDSAGKLQQMVLASPVGGNLQLSVLRGGRTQTVKVTLGKRPLE